MVYYCIALLSFCIFSLFQVSRTYRAQTKFHAENVNVWIAWAKYELEWKSNFDGARNILVSSASRHHPKSIQLKREVRLRFIDTVGNVSGKCWEILGDYKKYGVPTEKGPL